MAEESKIEAAKPGEPKSQGWWQTLPGIITATAGAITAAAGLVIALHQAGFFGGEGKPASVAGNEAARPSLPPRSSSASPEPTPDATAAPAPPASESSPAPAPPVSQAINLLAAENGGHLIVASSDDWKTTIDGKEDGSQMGNGIGAEAVYAFQEERPATFHTFTMLIPESADANVKEFELLIGNDSPTGPFKSIDKFETQNIELFKTPYQEFKFPAVRAKYLKVKLLSTFGHTTHPGIHEFQLLGSLE